MIIHTDFAHLYYYKFFRDLFIPQNIYKSYQPEHAIYKLMRLDSTIFRDVFDLAEFFEIVNICFLIYFYKTNSDSTFIGRKTKALIRDLYLLQADYVNKDLTTEKLEIYNLPPYYNPTYIFTNIYRLWDFKSKSKQSYALLFNN